MSTQVRRPSASGGNRRHRTAASGRRPVHPASGPGGAGRRPRTSGAKHRRKRRQKRMIRFLTAWAVCILTVGLIAAGTVRAVSAIAASGRNRLRTEGIEKLAAGDFNGAIQSFEQALEKAGDREKAFNRDVLLYRAEAELKLQDYEAAAHSYELLAGMGEPSPSVLYMRSICMAKLGNADQALEFFREAVQGEKDKQRSEGYEEALAAAGAVMIRNEDYQNAMELYEKEMAEGEQSDGTKSRLYNQMGLCRMAEEDWQGALDCFDQGYSYLTTHYQAGTGAEPAQVNQAVLQEDGAGRRLLKDLLFNRGTALEYLQRYEDALAQFETYIQVFGEEDKVEHEIDFLSTRVQQL